MNTSDTTKGKAVSEPNHVAVDLYRGEARIINGKRHSTLCRNEIRVINAQGKTVCIMADSNQDALDTAWLIAKTLDRIPEPTAAHGSLREFLERGRNQNGWNH